MMVMGSRSSRSILTAPATNNLLLHGRLIRGAETDCTTEMVRQYYAIAGLTAGMREDTTFYYFLTDHLGSVVAVTDSSGTMVSETRYLPFGEIRTDVGTVSQTDYGFTFQRNDSYIKLLDNCYQINRVEVT